MKYILFVFVQESFLLVGLQREADFRTLNKKLLLRIKIGKL